ncbi:unnamed protein product, partial [Prorocentrum cordatum]
ADLQAGRTAAWERKANSVADTFAKRGAAMHPDASEAAKNLAGRAATPPAPSLSVRIRSILSLQAEAPVDSELALLAQLFAREIHVVRVFDAAGGLALAAPRLLCCTSCGAFAWGAARDPLQPRKGERAGSGCKQQKARVARGLFPRWLGQHAGWTLGALETPSASDLAQLANAALRRIHPAPLASLAVFPGVAWQADAVSSTLAHCGLAPSSLAQWAEAASSWPAMEAEESDHGA